MSKRAPRTTPGPATRETIGGKRRDVIFRALHECVVDKGYAATSLADIARRADMSPSHLLYYFPGKDAVLVQYFTAMKRRIFARLESIRHEPPARQVDLLARLFFSGSAISKSENGVMLECFGVAVHDKQLRQAKTRLDRHCKAHLREFLEKSPCGRDNAADAAEVAYALLVGLRTATYFDERLRPQKAYDTFRGELLKIAGLDRRARPIKAPTRAARGNGKATASRVQTS